MHRIVKKTLQYTGFLFLSLIVLLIAGISYLYFSADMQTPKHEQSMTTDKVIDIDSLHLRHYGDNFLRHSDSGLWELFVKGDAFQRGEAIGQLEKSTRLCIINEFHQQDLVGSLNRCQETQSEDH